MYLKPLLLKIYTFTFCALIIFILPSTTFSCSCSIWFTPPCVAYQRNTIAFIGVIKEIHEQEAILYKANIDVERFLKGSAEKRISLDYDPKCGGKFEIGKKYLIYANKKTGHSGFVLESCGGTAMHIENASDYIEYLERAKEGKAPLLIQGFLLSVFEDFSQSNIVASDGKKIIESKINKIGDYSIQVDKASSYNVKLFIPFEITFSDMGRKDIKITTISNSTVIEYTAIVGMNQCDYKELEIRYRSKTDEWFESLRESLNDEGKLTQTKFTKTHFSLF